MADRKPLARYSAVDGALARVLLRRVTPLPGTRPGWLVYDFLCPGLRRPHDLADEALVMAIWRRGKCDALLHHSDRRSQYTSEQFQRLTSDSGVVCSMSRSGNVLIAAFLGPEEVDAQTS
jgi:hypothetical protein